MQAGRIAAACPASAGAASSDAGTCGSPHSAAKYLRALRRPAHAAATARSHLRKQANRAFRACFLLMFFLQNPNMCNNYMLQILQHHTTKSKYVGLDDDIDDSVSKD